MKKTLLVILFLFSTMVIQAQPCTPNTHSIDFNGTSDFIGMQSSPALDITGDLSIEAWINPASFGITSAQGSIVCKHGWSSGEGGYVLRAGAQGELSFNIGGIDTNGQPTSWIEVASPVNAITLNTWTHVAGTFNGDSLNIYVSGQLVATTLFTGSIAPSSTYIMKIGNLADVQPGVFRFWDGLIDEVRVWNRALTAAEITGNMNTQIDPVIQTGLVGYWRLNEGTGTLVSDLSSFANTGGLTGSGWSTNVPFSTGAPSAIITPSGNTTFCQGNSVTLTAPAGTGISYLWSTTDTTQSIIVNSSGVFTVTVSDVNGCSATSNPVTVTVHTGPAVPTISFNGSQLSTSATTGIQWYLNGSTLFNQVNQNLIPLVNGSYTVIVTDNNGCTASSAPYVVNTIGIEETMGVASFGTEYSNGNLTVSAVLLRPENVEISVNDVAGRKVMEPYASRLPGLRHDITLDFTNLQSGIYMVTLKTRDGYLSRKVQISQ